VTPFAGDYFQLLENRSSECVQTPATPLHIWRMAMQQALEGCAMVVVFKVAQLMNDDGIDAIQRRFDEMCVQGNAATRAAAAPLGPHRPVPPGGKRLSHPGQFRRQSLEAL